MKEGGSLKEYLPLLIPFFGGIAVETANFFITRAVLKKQGGATAALALRSLLAAGYLIAVYFIAKALTPDPGRYLIAAAVGASVGLLVFTILLMSSLKGGGANG